MRCMKTRVVSRPPTEEELVERARGGDAAAFGALVRAHQEIAFRTAYLITRNAADAEDASQTRFTKAWRALPRFRRGAPLRPWLLAIVANEARNRRRAEGRREGLTLRAARELPSGDAAPSPEGSVVAAEARAELLAGLERLRDADRARARLPLPARARRGGDRARALGAPRDRQVANLARARAAARELEVDERARATVSSSSARRSPGPRRLPSSRDLGPARARRPVAPRAGRRARRSPRRARGGARVLLRRAERLPRALPHPWSHGRARGATARGPTQRNPARATGQPRGGRARASASGSSTSASRTRMYLRGTGRLPRLRPFAAAAARAHGGPRRSGTGSSRRSAATGTTVEQVTRRRASPASSSPATQHFVMFIGGNGVDRRTSRPILAGTVLLWNRGPLLLRLEGDLTRDEAVELAESVEGREPARPERCIHDRHPYSRRSP